MDVNDSILTSIKKPIGYTEEQTDFDQDIIMHINKVFFQLRQIGVVPSTGFVVSDKTQNWSDLYPDNPVLIEAVKTYVYDKVKLAFDPPSSSVAVEALKQDTSELEWRLYTEAETINWSSQIEENTREIEKLKGRMDTLEAKSNEHEDLFRVLVGDQNE